MKRPSPVTDPAAEAFRERLVSQVWRVVHTDPADGPWNMAVDEGLLEAAGREVAPPTLRFYAWRPPAVSLGRFQDSGGVDLDYARARGWDVVRRPTGGRGVLHQHEVTYSLTLPPSLVAGVGVRTSYAVLTAGLHAGLRSLLGASFTPEEGAAAPACERGAGVANCFALASECDTLVPEGKLVGSAQVRRAGALLQHGSILLDAEPLAWTALFGSPGRLVTLRQILGGAPEPRRVAEAVTEGFRSLGVRVAEGTLSAQEAAV